MDYFNHLNDTCEPLSESQITDAPYVHLSTYTEKQSMMKIKEYRFKRIPASRWNNAYTCDRGKCGITGEEGL